VNAASASLLEQQGNLETKLRVYGRGIAALDIVKCLCIVQGRLASNTAASGRGLWHLARSKALSVGLSNKYFSSLGLPSLLGTR